MRTLLQDGERTRTESPRPNRLLVTRRNPETRRYLSLGLLSCEPDGYRFGYLRSAIENPDFQPLPGLGQANRAYEAEQLFPVFAERVMSSRRPDRREALASLGLPETAAPFEVLINSGGRSVGDAVELLPAPKALSDGSLTLDFLVHGVRHMSPRSQDRISELRPGEPLLLILEPENPVNARACLVSDRDRLPLGYVPDPLLPILEAMTAPSAQVVRANDARVGFHFRLAVRIEGNVGAGVQPFDGPGWALVGE